MKKRFSWFAAWLCPLAHFPVAIVERPNLIRMSHEVAMALSRWFSFSHPFVFWLLRLVPGPVSSVADLLSSVQSHQQMLNIDEAIRRLTEGQDRQDARFARVVRQTHLAIQRILEAQSVEDINSQIGSITECGKHGIHALLSPEVVGNPALKAAFFGRPEEFGTVFTPTDEFKPNGLQILAGEREQIVVSPSPSTLFQLIDKQCGTRTNFDSVSQSEWFNNIRRRNLQRVAW